MADRPSYTPQWYNQGVDSPSWYTSADLNPFGWKWEQKWDTAGNPTTGEWVSTLPQDIPPGVIPSFSNFASETPPSYTPVNLTPGSETPTYSQPVSAPGWEYKDTGSIGGGSWQQTPISVGGGLSVIPDTGVSAGFKGQTEYAPFKFLQNPANPEGSVTSGAGYIPPVGSIQTINNLPLFTDRSGRTQILPNTSLKTGEEYTGPGKLAVQDERGSWIYTGNGQSVPTTSDFKFIPKQTYQEWLSQQNNQNTLPFVRKPSYMEQFGRGNWAVNEGNQPGQFADTPDNILALSKMAQALPNRPSSINKGNMLGSAIAAAIATIASAGIGSAVMAPALGITAAAGGALGGGAAGALMGGLRTGGSDIGKQFAGVGMGGLSGAAGGYLGGLGADAITSGVGSATGNVGTLGGSTISLGEALSAGATLPDLAAMGFNVPAAIAAQTVGGAASGAGMNTLTGGLQNVINDKPFLAGADTAALLGAASGGLGKLSAPARTEAINTLIRQGVNPDIARTMINTASSVGTSAVTPSITGKGDLGSIATNAAMTGGITGLSNYLGNAMGVGKTVPNLVSSVGSSLAKNALAGTPSARPMAMPQLSPTQISSLRNLMNTVRQPTAPAAKPTATGKPTLNAAQQATLAVLQSKGLLGKRS